MSFPGWNCMTHRQALQGFPDMSQISLHKTMKSTYLFIAVPAGSREVTITFNFISERTVLSSNLFGETENLRIASILTETSTGYLKKTSL
jgi:hypothetical protein